MSKSALPRLVMFLDREVPGIAVVGVSGLLACGDPANARAGHVADARERAGDLTARSAPGRRSDRVGAWLDVDRPAVARAVALLLDARGRRHQARGARARGRDQGQRSRPPSLRRGPLGASPLAVSVVAAPAIVAAPWAFQARARRRSRSHCSSGSCGCSPPTAEHRLGEFSSCFRSLSSGRTSTAPLSWPRDSSSCGG